MSQVGHQRGKQADPPPVDHDTWPSLTLSYRLDLFLGAGQLPWTNRAWS